MEIYKVVNRIKMSQSGEENEVPQQEPVEEEKADNIKDPIKSVIKKSQANDGLVKGLNEVCKCLDRKQAILCILAEDCNDPKYKKLVDALAKASNVPLIEVEKRDDLGEIKARIHMGSTLAHTAKAVDWVWQVGQVAVGTQ